MELQTKALYNLLRLNRAQDPSVACEKWQIEDMRSLSLDTLFDRLHQAKLVLNKERFLQFAQECDCPEDLAELLLEEYDNPKQHDPFYLVLFELWRRLLPERQSLSIFCDELDHRISLYDAGLLESDELIQDALANLKEVLDENVDAGAESSEVMEIMNSYCAHDLMTFLIDYISELLDNGNQLYASELLENFSDYASEPLWFDFLHARLTAISDPIEANRGLLRVLEQDRALTIDLLLEMLRFQTSFGELPVFVAIVQKVLPLTETQEEFQDLTDLVVEYFRRRDRDDLVPAVRQVLLQRKKEGGAIHSSDLSE